MRFRLLTVAILAAFIGAFIVAPASTAAQPNRTANVSTTLQGTTADGDLVTVVGNVSNLAASVVGGVVQVTGTFTPTDGSANPFNFVANLTQGSASCQILILDLGPIFLDLLGLQLETSQIVIELTAQPGPGNLLGNLLCAVAGLLDRGGPLQGIANLLNNLFRNL
jgi:hypothetical protein